MWFADGIKGRHVLIGFLAFFGVIFLANGIFLYYALTTFGGGETTDPYRKGLHYNETIAEAARSDERGWREQLIYTAGSRRLSLSVSDNQGLPVSGLHIDAHIGRPVTDREDTSIKFKEIAAGSYEAELPPVARAMGGAASIRRARAATAIRPTASSSAFSSRTGHDHSCAAPPDRHGR